MKIFHFLLSILLLSGKPVAAQLQEYAAMKEKVYLHFNHVLYAPGDAVFFKAYVTKGADLKPSFYTGNVHVEWFAPDGKMVRHQQFAVKDGYAEGSYYFDGNAKGGIYKVRAYTQSMRNESDSTWFSKEITLQKIVSPRLLLELDFPQKGYGAGAMVTASFTARTLDDKPVSGNEFSFSVQIDGKPYSRGTSQTGPDGKSTIRFSLPDSLRTTDVLLLVALKSGGITESISRSVPVVLNRIDLQFLPEGGTLVAGTLANIAFRAVDEFGKPANVRGTVFDQHGVAATSFEVYRYGMGKFAFTPEPGKRYHAKLTGPQGGDTTYAFPQATATGVSMRCYQDSLQIVVHMAGNDDRPLELTAHLREQLLESQPVRLAKGNYIVVFRLRDWPAGIVRLRLQTPDGTPLAERRMFVRHDRRMRVSLQPDKAQYLPREPVKLHIKTTDADGSPLPANISLSVVDDKLWTFADDRQDHLLSWLLFSSELRGKVEEPAFYFRENEPQALPALDLVMLTHGYRYFEPIPVFRQSGIRPFPFRDEIRLLGVVLTNSGVPVKCPVYLYNTATKKLGAVAMTDELGRFEFTGLLESSYHSVVAGPLPRDSTVWIYDVNWREHPEVLSSMISADHRPVPQIVVKNTSVADTVVAGVVSRQSGAAVVDPPVVPGLVQGKALAEVVTVGYGVAGQKVVTATAVHVFNSVLLPGEPVMGTLQGLVAGMQIQQAANPLAGGKILIRGASSLSGSNEPLVIVNGMRSTMAEIQQNIANIASITVLKDQATMAQYGSAAANGVIIVGTNGGTYDWKRIPLSGRDNYVTRDYIHTSVQFDRAERFYTPYYNANSGVLQDDFRETIYWNPVIFTDAKGEATVTFRNSDASTTFRMIAEGIGYNGMPGRMEGTYATAARVVAEMRVPKELLSGDVAMLQMHLKNNDTKAQVLQIEMQVPAFLKMRKTSFTDTLMPGEAKMVGMPALVLKEGKGALVSTVFTGTGRKEHKTYPIAARERGFPVVQGFAGDRTATHAFTAENVVPGSLRYSAQVFRHTGEQLEEGLAAMLRQPHGCFEQVSSTTYPNILILQLLESGGNAEPAVRNKAMRYLEEGYKKLIAFETPEQGFEWFGHLPASPLLTAYGLLEFTDMQRFVDVDTAMLERTRRFLLRKRNGTGGFSQGKREMAMGYDAAADSYIMFAMAETGLGDSVLTEYKASFLRALEGKNPWETAIAALVAQRLGRGADVNRLLPVMESQRRTGVSAFYCWGASLEIEVAALRVLVYSRMAQPPVVKIAREIGVIRSRRSQYGYGSTHATILALKALMAYGKLQVAGLEAPLALALNGQPLTADAKEHALAPGRHTFAVRYPAAAAGKPYLLEASWRATVPPSQEGAPIRLYTQLDQDTVTVGGTVRMKIEVRNTTASDQAMTIAKVAIPGGLQLQPWQLKEWTDRREVAYCEIFDGYLVLYWRSFQAEERKILHLDLKADFAGKYRAQAGSAGLYYVPEQSSWHAGAEITVLPTR